MWPYGFVPRTGVGDGTDVLVTVGSKITTCVAKGVAVLCAVGAVVAVREAVGIINGVGDGTGVLVTVGSKITACVIKGCAVRVAVGVAVGDVVGTFVGNLGPAGDDPDTTVPADDIGRNTSEVTDCASSVSVAFATAGVAPMLPTAVLAGIVAANVVGTLVRCGVGILVTRTGVTVARVDPTKLDSSCSGRCVANGVWRGSWCTVTADSILSDAVAVDVFNPSWRAAMTVVSASRCAEAGVCVGTRATSGAGSGVAVDANVGSGCNATCCGCFRMDSNVATGPASASATVPLS